MRKLATAAALAVLTYACACEQASAKSCGVVGTTSQGADAPMFTLFDGSCSSDNQATDVDDLKAFIDKSTTGTTTDTSVDFSLSGNTSTTADQNIVFNDLTTGSTFKDGNGFATIMATVDNIQSIELDPILGSSLDKAPFTFNGFDGFLFRLQMSDFVATPDPPGDTATVTMTINLSDGTTVIDTFDVPINGGTNSGLTGVFGFDELAPLGTLAVNSVDLTTDANHSFDQIKEMFFSVPGATAEVPEPATWVMLLTGFGLLSFAASQQRRREAAV